MPDLDGRVCVVTGAGRGIGRRIAERLAEAGSAVAIADIDGASAEAVAAAISAPGKPALGVGCDVSDRASVRDAIARTIDAFGRLDVMFNNAGISQTKGFLDVTEDEWERIMRVNGLGVLLGMQEAARQMISQGDGGRIINTASIAGKEGYPLFAAYCASKFAVVALTQAGARSLAGNRITVNAMCPGVVTTELWQQLDAEFMELGETERPGQALEEFGAGILAGRLSTPDDVAGLAVFLASDAASYITGQAINVDGGMVFH
ncbi:glucose 1-dehydrogenase [Capillimicrobium parvum]|uniref:Diacetyl reductase [(S)-acetoin forming] n=1 Tax=Capillimicrobium parvum TaxID=2884022 RepID=A0A9E7C6V0_9ACTN|nr:glucose 1-dehydrogenase [Capillimicrobium parvum]UGS38983.1 Diacetyl reductase [(S)-acetoin forming] [Capillimicrobium parvum]